MEKPVFTKEGIFCCLIEDKEIEEIEFDTLYFYSNEYGYKLPVASHNRYDFCTINKLKSICLATPKLGYIDLYEKEKKYLRKIISIRSWREFRYFCSWIDKENIVETNELDIKKYEDEFSKLENPEIIKYAETYREPNE